MAQFSLGDVLGMAVRGKDDEAARVHQVGRRRGCVAVNCRRAAEQRGLAPYRRGRPSAQIAVSTLQAFREGLRDEGYVEDHNIRLENRYADGVGGLEKAAAELTSLNVKVILAGGTPAVLALRRATKSIPIVGGAMADPVADGSVVSLARPGGNVTGNTFLGPELMPKRLQLLREIVPGTDRMAALVHPGVYGEATMRNMSAAIEAAAKASGVKLQIFNAGSPNDFDGAFAAMAATQAGALIVLPSPMFYVNHRRLVDLSARNRLPTMYVFREAVEAGGLICYGPDIPDLLRLGGKYVGKILKGAKPSDLPVEEPVKFEFAVNHKTAKALGLTVPPMLLATADEVIE
jgi:putative tryptophan/tyrosine transport system substrate-binding protein